MTVKSSISLTDEQYAFARDLVESGRFASVSSVLQQGVELLRTRVEREVLETEALAEILAARQAGRFVSGEEMDGRIEALLARKRALHEG